MVRVEAAATVLVGRSVGCRPGGDARAAPRRRRRQTPGLGGLATRVPRSAPVAVKDAAEAHPREAPSGAAHGTRLDDRAGWRRAPRPLVGPARWPSHSSSGGPTGTGSGTGSAGSSAGRHGHRLWCLNRLDDDRSGRSGKAHSGRVGPGHDVLTGSWRDTSRSPLSRRRRKLRSPADSPVHKAAKGLDTRDTNSPFASRAGADPRWGLVRFASRLPTPKHQALPTWRTSNREMTTNSTVSAMRRPFRTSPTRTRPASPSMPSARSGSSPSATTTASSSPGSRSRCRRRTSRTSRAKSS